MKYVITGAAGHISKPLAGKLLAEGHQVVVIGRSPDHLKPLTDKGAEAAIGSVEDVDFLKKTFSGTDAVYLMVPPQYGGDIEGYKPLGEIFKEAIHSANIGYVVVLSSIGAHLPGGCGPVTGLHHLEEILNKMNDVHIKYLRPAFFYINFFGNMDMIRNMNILGGNYGDSDAKLVMTDPSDIAEAAAEELLTLKFKGHSIRYIASDERTTGEVAKVLGSAVGKPDLPWVGFTDEQTLSALKQMDLPKGMAENYVEMGAAIRSGVMWEDYLKHKPEQMGKVKLEDFAKIFAGAYQSV